MITRATIFILATLACSIEFTDQIVEAPTHGALVYCFGNQEVEASGDSVYLHTGWYHVVESKPGVARALDRTSEIYWIDTSPIVTADNIVKYDLYKEKFNNRSWGLAMQLDSAGTAAWSVATNQSIGNRLAFIIDNKLISVPMVNSEINFGMTALNRGIYSKMELRSFMKNIQSSSKRWPLQ